MELIALAQIAKGMGAHDAAVIPVKELVFDREFRTLCESNACGMYGKCWTCPPNVGDIDLLIANAKSFDGVLVCQTVSKLEDSYDFEGMMAASRRHNDIMQQISRLLPKLEAAQTLLLGAGGCRVCEVCAKRNDAPCRFPEQALASLEAYGIAVSQMAEAAGMKYINGQDTVTYFGACFCRL